MERMMASLSVIFARRGRCSQTWMPGTFVGIGLNSPRISIGIGLLALAISNQFLHRLAAGVHEVLRTTAEVVDGDFAHVDAEVVIKRREHVAELNRTLSRFAAEPVGGADHLAGLHPAAS